MEARLLEANLSLEKAWEWICEWLEVGRKWKGIKDKIY